jgi:capsular polysaccharide biosynthesis protein
MDETIDLRPYLQALVRHIWLIIGAIALAIVVGVVLNRVSDDYQASTLVTIPDPSQQLQFDPRIINTLQPSQMLFAFPNLALSDEVISRVMAQTPGVDETITTATKLRGLMEVDSAGDPRLLRLSISHREPETAAVLANIWADEFVAVVDGVYGSGGVDFFANRLNEAGLELQAAEDALVSFQTTNRQGIVDNELASLLELQRAYLTEQRTLTQVLDDIKGLRTQLEGNSVEVVTLAEQLSALTIQLRVYESVQPSIPMFSTPVAMQIPPSAPEWQLSLGADAQVTTGERAQQLQMLDALRRSVESSLIDRQSQLTALEGPIFALQTEKQRLFNEGERLISRRDIAQETYATVARKVDEERVGAAETVAHVASRAAVPEFPTRPNLLVLLPLLSVAAALVSMAAIIALTWWRGAHPA